MSLHDYLNQLQQTLDIFNTYGFSESIEVRQEIRSGKQAVIFAKVVLVNFSVLIIKEYIEGRYKLEKLSYAYQYQTEKGDLIFRYDNAQHKPKLKYLEHKHLEDGRIIAQNPPEMSELVNEVIQYL